MRLVADVTPGARDDVVLADAVRDAELVVTADKDFGALVYLGRHAHLGVVLVRMHPVSAHVERIARVLSDRRGQLGGAFVVIDARRVRVRRRPGDS